MVNEEIKKLVEAGKDELKIIEDSVLIFLSSNMAKGFGKDIEALEEIIDRIVDGKSIRDPEPPATILGSEEGRRVVLLAELLSISVGKFVAEIAAAPPHDGKTTQDFLNAMPNALTSIVSSCCMAPIRSTSAFADRIFMEAFNAGITDKKMRIHPHLPILREVEIQDAPEEASDTTSGTGGAQQ